MSLGLEGFTADILGDLVGLGERFGPCPAPARGWTSCGGYAEGRSRKGVLDRAAVAQQPGGGADAPGHRPQCARMRGHLWGDTRVVGFVGGVGHDVLDDAIQETVTLARSCRARSANGGSPSRSATMSSCSLALSQLACASSTSGSTGPANSQSMSATGIPSRATMFHGATSQ